LQALLHSCWHSGEAVCYSGWSCRWSYCL
jgi:hypothetical protein